MNRILHAALFLAFVGATPNSAPAQHFTSSYAEWRELSPASRDMYVAGMFEGVAVIGLDPGSIALGQGLVQCMVRLKITNTMMAEQVSRHYEKTPSDWGERPFAIFWQTIVAGVCLPHIDEFRRNHGLEPWKK